MRCFTQGLKYITNPTKPTGKNFQRVDKMFAIKDGEGHARQGFNSQLKF